MYVLYDGRVFPCCHPQAHRTMPVGELLSQTFPEIWNSAFYRSLRQGMRTGDVPAACCSCSIVHDPGTAPEEVAADGGELVGFYADREHASDAGESLGANRRVVAQHLGARMDEVDRLLDHISPSLLVPATS